MACSDIGASVQRSSADESRAIKAGGNSTRIETAKRQCKTRDVRFSDSGIFDIQRLMGSISDYLSFVIKAISVGLARAMTTACVGSLPVSLQ